MQELANSSPMEARMSEAQTHAGFSNHWYKKKRNVRRKKASRWCTYKSSNIALRCCCCCEARHPANLKNERQNERSTGNDENNKDAQNSIIHLCFVSVNGIPNARP
eukprot:gb/GECG01010752.1/.p1 GENE.gb/GECG01010752.1/~~gb/GECG01010752.1/.p1  ORF type:complete len:106 (+),score=16.25 gb/GECG01010752.1/:1-318(+)